MGDKDLGAGKTCFVVSPIGSKLEPVGSAGRLRYEESIHMWENAFLPSCETFGLQPIRADKIATPGEIPKQIFTHLRDADVVIADLSEGNANVMYELGLRHTKNKITLQVGEYGRLPFDVNTIRTIQFNRTESGLIDAREALVDALRAALLGDYSPVAATEVWAQAGVALSADEVKSAVAVSLEPDDHTVYDDDAPGRLELLAEGEAALNGIAELLEKFNVEIVETGDKATASTPAMQAATSYAGRLTAVKMYAESVQTNAANMDELSNQFFKDVKKIDVMVQLVMGEWREEGLPSDEEERESAVAYLEGLAELADAARGSRPSMSELSQTITGLRGQSRLLATVSKSMGQSLTRFISGADIVVSWGDAAALLLSAADTA